MIVTHVLHGPVLRNRVRLLGTGFLPVLLIGGASGALYLLVYRTQRALYHLTFDGVTVREVAADRTPMLVQSAAYYGATLALFALYVGLLALCRRGGLRDRRACALALVFPVLFNLGMLLGRPYLSIDLYSYIGFGYLGSTPGGNPYLQPVSSLEHTPLGASLTAYGWRPTHGLIPYGPLWVRCTTTILSLTQDVPTATLLFKGLVVAASLGSAALIWAILGRVRPGDRLLGTLLYLWNPVVVVELAGEGHNDGLVILCVLAALFLTLTRRPALAFALLLLGVLTKYLPLILLPTQLTYFWFTARDSRDRRHLLLLLLLGLLAGLGVAVLLFRPLWVGGATFQGLREEGEPVVSASITGGLYWLLTHSPLRAVAAPLTSVALAGTFAACALFASWRVRDTEGLLRACAGISMLYVLLASPYYFPWYSALPLALLALCPQGTFRWVGLALALTCGARLVAPLAYLRDQGLIAQPVKFALTIIAAIALPLLVLVLPTIWGRGSRGSVPNGLFPPTRHRHVRSFPHTGEATTDRDRVVAGHVSGKGTVP